IKKSELKRSKELFNLHNLDDDIQDFEDRLARIYDRQVHRAPEKVTTTDLFYLRSMDEEETMNFLYFLEYYIFRHASGRKHGAKMSGAMGLERQHAGAAARSAHVDPEVA
nr:hypothetical protein [Tanacetum cinerariifolium]